MRLLRRRWLGLIVAHLPRAAVPPELKEVFRQAFLRRSK
jgi:hypothetical protein